MHDEPTAEGLIQELNLVLIEYSVFTSSMQKRRELLGPLVSAGTTPEKLRMACAHLEKTSNANIAAQITLAVRDDPQLKALLYAASKWQERHEPEDPGEAERRENSEREKLNTQAQEDRLKMRAYQELLQRTASSPHALARILEVSMDRLGDLVEGGADMYNTLDIEGFPQAARHFLMRGQDYELTLWVMAATKQKFRGPRAARRFDRSQKDLPPELRREAVA